MERSENFQTGTLKVSENVIFTIAKNATLEIKGVDSLAPVAPILKNAFIKSEKNNAIKIRLTGDVVEISISINVKMGNKVTVVAEEIQNNVKSSVQTMTGVAVARVNVTIAGIVFDNTNNN